jgi:hypothetical protein
MTDLLLWPVINGLLVASLLALAGAALFLRGSGWQALATCQSAAAGGVMASAAGLAVTPIALATALLALGLMRFAGARINPGQSDPARVPLAVFLVATALTSLLAANMATATLASARWVEGEVLFAIAVDVLWAFGLALITLVMLPRLTSRWLTEQCAPDRSARLTSDPFNSGLELLWLTLVLVVGARTLGVPAALAALLFPVWAAARVASSYRGFLIAAQVLGLGAMATAWIPVVLWDQPFAPLLVLGNGALAATVVLVSAGRSALR